MASADLAVIILSYNEDRNIARAIGSVAGWAREIYVVDSFSSDRTVEVAASFPNVQIAYHAFRNYGDQWAWALENLPLRASWILKLDADEQVTPALRDEMIRVLGRGGERYVAYEVRRRLYFMQRELRFGGFSSTWHVRLWRRGRGRFERRMVNEQLIVCGPVGRLRGYLVHDDRKGLSAWIWRHNRYSSLEAEEASREQAAGDAVAGAAGWRRWAKRRIWPWIPFKPTMYFIYLYFLRLGFLDGRAGYHLCRLRSFYYYLIELKKKEKKMLGYVSTQECLSPMPSGPPDGGGSLQEAVSGQGWIRDD